MLTNSKTITGFVCGVFDLFHYGHVLMLEECKTHCDYLIVAVNKATNLPTHKNSPIFSIEHRVAILKQNKHIDEVLVYETEEELEQLLVKLKPAMRFLGEDYINKKITGIKHCKKIHYISRSHGFSTSYFIERIKQ